MTTNHELQNAVEQGIISQEQFDKLAATASAETREDIEEALDEAPRFIRSFGDFFIAIGTCFFGAGLWAAVGFMGASVPVVAGAMLLIWLVAEWLTGYLRISAPSIVLCVLFVWFSYLFVAPYIYHPVVDGSRLAAMVVQSKLVDGACVLIAATLFYARFRLPFAMAIIGASVLVIGLAVVAMYAQDFMLENFRFIVGFGGLLIFIGAMWFDMKDPLRKGRLADCGFWLHLIAAPLLTHSILWDSHPAITGLKSMLGTFKTDNSWLIIGGLFLVFGIVALIINRRALMISSLGYVGSVIAYGIWKLDLPTDAAMSVVLMIIAALILVFGVGWQPLRRIVLSLLPHGKYLDKLPPARA